MFNFMVTFFLHTKLPKSLTSLKLMYAHTSKALSLRSLLIIPRSAHGQYYIVNGLYSSLHFSLGPNGRHAFIIFLHHCGINVNFGCQSPVLFVKTSVQYKKTKIKNEYFNLMVRMGSQLWHALFVVSS